MEKKIEIQLVRSVAGCPKWMRRIADSLALRKLQDKVIVPDNGAMRGMAKHLHHLVSVREVKE